MQNSMTQLLIHAIKSKGLVEPPSKLGYDEQLHPVENYWWTQGSLSWYWFNYVSNMTASYMVSYTNPSFERFDMNNNNPHYGK